MNFDDLPEALAWLDGHIDFESSMPSRRALPTLDRMRALADLLGEPQSAYPAIHITGTNGKGSTAAMVTALFGAQGLTVGTYTSPNLSRVNERIVPQRRTHRRRCLASRCWRRWPASSR